MVSTWVRPKRLRVTWVTGAWVAPGRAKLRATRQQGQHAGRGGLVEHQAQHLQRGGVGPVQVFPHRQDGLPLRLLQQPGHQGFLRLLSLPLGRQVQRRITLRQGHGEQRGKERHDLLQGQAIRPQHPLQRVELRLWGRRRAATARTAAGGRSPGTGHCSGNRGNSETQCALRPRASHARAAPPPGAICQCRPRRAAAPPGPYRPGSAPSAPAAAPLPTRGPRGA